jgi:hypothetical protein
MPDFYADFPVPEVIIKIADAEKFCSIGDCIAGMKSGIGRVEEFVEGGIRVHPTVDQEFCVGDALVSPTASSAAIQEVTRC